MLPLPGGRLRQLPGQAGQVIDDGYEEYVGVIHVHTTYSHDADGRFEDVVRVANAQRLDYVLITEHNTLQPLREGRQGWYGPTLVLIGMELSTRAGHYLAFNVTHEIERRGLTSQEVIDAVNQQGGLGFIAHPYFKKAPWRDWSVTGYTGIEAYNVLHDAIDENRLRLALWTIGASAEALYRSLLDRPYDPLAVWDAMIVRHGRVVGIGATDAHEVHVFGVTFAPYEMMFRLARTHLLVPSPTLTAEAVYEALRRGRAYFAIELDAQAKGFTFVAEDAKQVLGVMGDTVTLAPNLRLSASLPTPAELILFRNGQRIGRTVSASWQILITEPGAYRLEAMRHGRPWIFSNPIYVQSATTANSTQQTAHSTNNAAP